ncbi:YkyA family protein [Planococcus lenghuensis]|uniref:Cell-wall binding lipoprotein n=1 Tax=Planococcus lenghuensis TaxID=2213202 RepID=A0A1Q2L069_9BACL|nr:YkyA family protein [Planococcus lenghuensis]AQQ53850.1 hypothetical protein B0X71_12630 [Planococcus lenghuensis]
MKKTITAAVLSSALLLGACSESSVREDLNSVLNDTLAAEEEYLNVQSELEELEQSEQQMFESVMALTQEEMKEVNELSAEALASVEERLALLETEKESIAAAAEQFEEIDSVIAEAEDEAIISELEALKTVMEERYAAHQTFIAEYEELAVLQNELYNLLGDEETDLEQLQEQTTLVNEQNEAVLTSVEAFNQKTEEFNTLKNSIIEQLEEEE